MQYLRATTDLQISATNCYEKRGPHYSSFVEVADQFTAVRDSHRASRMFRMRASI